jgi:hypothetical protein
MWSYSAPDRTPQPSTAPSHDGDEKVARRHEHPQGQSSALRLIRGPVNDTTSQKESLS